MHDELLGIEIHGIPGPHTPTPTPYNTLTAAGRGRRSAAAWPIAFDPVEECAMTLLQQAVLKMRRWQFMIKVSRASARDRNLCRCLGDGSATEPYPEALTSRNSHRGKVGQ